VSVIDPEGLFNGDRLRRCSNAAQLHWPRLFLASDGFARLEINYARIVGRAYGTFSPIPSETELQSWIQEYVRHYLLFIYQVDGQVWGQWDTRAELLPRYKTSSDRRSPAPPEQAFIEWKRRYRGEIKSFPKCFGNISEAFQPGVGVGGGKNICASPSGNAEVSAHVLIEPGCSEAIESDFLFPPQKVKPNRHRGRDLTVEQDRWFDGWWPTYWRRVAKKAARQAFREHVTTESRFQQVMAATTAQTPEMLARSMKNRPYPATWLNGERWEDETADPAQRETVGARYTKLEISA
jgi:hypothetical protein